MRKFIKLLILPLYLVLPIDAFAYQITQGFFSSVGGSLNGTQVDIPKCSMQPFGDLTTDDIRRVYNRGSLQYQKGKAFLDSLNLAKSENPDIAKLISNPNANYGSLGFIKKFENDTINYFLNARRNFLYGAFYGDPESIEMLNACTRAMASIYIAFGDEYFIDGLDHRITAEIIDVDDQIGTKLTKVTKAAEQYAKAVAVFVDALAESVGNIYVGDFFQDAEYDLFNLASERLSMALTHQASLEYLANMSSDPSCQWRTAAARFKRTIAKAATEAYIQAAALGVRNKAALERSAGLLHNLSLLRQKGMLAGNNMNILGYDNRFVPMANFDGPYGLHKIAQEYVAIAEDSEDEAVRDTREYDSSETGAEGEKARLYDTYAKQLSELTGVPLPASLPSDRFLARVAPGGVDLLDCSMGLNPAEFKTCLQGKTTGALAGKYNQIKDADLKVQLAIQQREHARERLKLEQERHAKEIQLHAEFLKKQTMSLEAYYQGLIAAQKNERNKREETTRVWNPEKDRWESKTKVSSTTRTIEFDPSQVLLGKKKEIDLLNLTTQQNLEILNARDEVVIRNLLMELDEALIGVDIATQEMNTISREFFDLLEQKNNLILRYLQAEDHYKYVRGRLLTARVLKSSAVLNAAHDLEIAKHFVYLAAKSLEYRFLDPIVGIGIPGGTLDIRDVFKAQTAGKLRSFLADLDGLNTILCGLGNTFKQTEIRFSIAEHMLGLTRQNLDPNQKLTYSQFLALRKKKFQEFVQQHIDSRGFLSFDFSTSVLNSAFYQPDLGVNWNLKNWHGSDPCGGVETMGFTVNILTNTQTGMPAPKPGIKMTHGGDSTFLYRDCSVKAYVPVKPSSFIAIPGSGIDPAENVTRVTVANPRINDSRLDPNRTEWVNDLKGCSVSASRWTFELTYDRNHAPFDYSKLQDIELVMDTIGIQSGCGIQ